MRLLPCDLPPCPEEDCDGHFVFDEIKEIDGPYTYTYYRCSDCDLRIVVKSIPVAWDIEP